MRRSGIAGIAVATGLLAAGPLWAQTQYTGYGDPTAAEQHVLEIINRARANPTAEGTRLQSASPPLPGGNITEGLTAGETANVGARPPLAMNSILLSIARTHSQNMWTYSFFDHEYPATVWPSDRATAAGYAWDKIGENIATSSSATAAYLTDYLMVDWLNGTTPYPGRGHRMNLLDIADPPEPVYREIGVGHYAGASTNAQGFKDFLTEDFGRRNSVGPFVVGVIYDDTGATPNFYDIGEGVAGVTISLFPAGSSFAVSASAGGYAFLVSGTGSVTVRATGGAFGSAVVDKVVTLTGENVKVDFKLSDATDTDADGLPDAWEQTHFGGLGQNGSGDFDGDTFTNQQELLAGTNPNNSSSFPGSGGPPPGGSSKSDSGCGSTGLDLLWPVTLLWLRRRLGRRHLSFHA